MLDAFSALFGLFVFIIKFNHDTETNRPHLPRNAFRSLQGPVADHAPDSLTMNSWLCPVSFRFVEQGHLMRSRHAAISISDLSIDQMDMSLVDTQVALLSGRMGLHHRTYDT
jgi:hypothetical protein